MYQIFAEKYPQLIKSWDQTIVASASSESNVIDILDFIGDDWWGGFSANRMSQKLRAIGDDKDIVVNINSPGGDVQEGITIFNMLNQHSGNVEIRILGMAASIASIIALAGNNTLISKYATYMMHDAWMFFGGNSSAMAEASDYLEKTSNNLATIYADKTGINIIEIREMMQSGEAIDGTYLTGEEAVDKGFADAFLEEQEIAKEEKASRNSLRIAERSIKAANPKLSRNEVSKIINELKGVSDSTPAVSDSGTPAAIEAAKLRLTMALHQS